MSRTSVKGGIEGKKQNKAKLPPPPSHASQFRKNVLDLEKVSGKRLLAVLLSLMSRSSLENSLHVFKIVWKIKESNFQAEG